MKGTLEYRVRPQIDRHDRGAPRSGINLQHNFCSHLKTDNITQIIICHISCICLHHKFILPMYNHTHAHWLCDPSVME